MAHSDEDEVPPIHLEMNGHLLGKAKQEKREDIQRWAGVLILIKQTAIAVWVSGGGEV